MAFTIVIERQDFVGPDQVERIELPASWPEFVRSAATVGRDVSSTTASIRPTLLRNERTWRQYMLWACLRQSAGSRTRSTRVVKTKAYDTLDRSEKGAVSFFIGQATAKYVAEKMFGCVLFAHLDSAL